MEIKIDYSKCCWKDGKCTSCGCGKCIGCAEVCPVGAIKRGKKIIINKLKCITCGACVSACKYGALKLE